MPFTKTKPPPHLKVLPNGAILTAVFLVGITTVIWEMLLIGSAQNVKETEPVAWINTLPSGSRVFYTSLGHPYDFEITQFRAMLRNAIYWIVKEKSVKNG